MGFDDIYLAGAAACLPERVSVADAVAEGLCDAAIARSTDFVSVSVTDGDPPAALAVRAAEVALKRSGHQAEDIGLTLHADVYYQGHDLWPPASYVQREIGATRGPSIEIRQMSNGGMAAVQLGAAFLADGTGQSAVLLTTGDVFLPPGFDRWRSDSGTFYADGGTALVLSRHDGFARLRSLATVSEPELEGMHRGDDPFGAAPFSIRAPLSLDSCKQDFVTARGQSYCLSRVASGQSEALEQALTQAGASLADIHHFVLPHFGLRRLANGYLRRWDVDPDRTTWSWARTVGHLGAGDQFAGLAHLVEQERARSGELCLVAAVGAGYTWTCAVIEFV